jgi:hypothetical protein
MTEKTFMDKAKVLMAAGVVLHKSLCKKCRRAAWKIRFSFATGKYLLVQGNPLDAIRADFKQKLCADCWKKYEETEQHVNEETKNANV